MILLEGCLIINPLFLLRKLQRQLLGLGFRVAVRVLVEQIPSRRGVSNLRARVGRDTVFELISVDTYRPDPLGFRVIQSRATDFANLARTCCLTQRDFDPA